MIDIGFFELCLVFIILLFVVGPDELPQFFNKLGRFVRNVKKLWHTVDSPFLPPFNAHKDLKEIQKQLQKNAQKQRGSDDENT